MLAAGDLNSERLKGVAVVTKRKDLRTGRSVWEQRRAPPVPHKPLKRDIETDVLVIGAGITGAMVADALSDGGLRVTVVDRRGPAKGSSTASTALVQYEIDTPLTGSRARSGARSAPAWRRSRLAVDALGAAASRTRCRGLSRRHSLYLAGNLLDRDGLAREHDARRAVGLASRFLERSELRARSASARPAALFGYGNLAIDPRKATMRCCDAAAARARAFSRRSTSWTSSQAEPRHRHRTERAAHPLPASRVRNRLRIAASRCRTQGHQHRLDLGDRDRAAAAPAMAGAMLIWEASDPYLYLRTTPDGRIVCGGEDEEFSDDDDARCAARRARPQTLAQAGRADAANANPTVEFAWAGTFGESDTGCRSSDRSRACRTAGWRSAMAATAPPMRRIAADVISGALTGSPDADADLYAFR